MHIVDMVYFWARSMPLRPALILPEGVITYRSLAQGVERAAEYFARSISDNSKPITVSLQVAPKLLIASLGLQRAGFPVIIATKTEFEHLPSSETNALVHQKGDTFFEGRTNLLFDESWLQIGANPLQQAKSFSQPRTKDTDIFFFTSGTTGRPKRIIRTQKAWEQRILFNSTSAFTDYERALVVTNPTSAFGFTRSYEILYAGKTVCFAPSGRPALWLVNTYDIDLIIASPQQALALADIKAKEIHAPLTSLKTLRIGGSIISRDGVQRIKDHLCRNIIITYSSTEAGTVAIAPYDMIADIPGAVGFVIPEAEVEIIDANDKVMPIGMEGFVRLRTKQFVVNFGIESSARWFYPGDVGCLTEDGVLCIAGRKGDVLNRGGVKLSVSDFEDFLRSCRGIKDAGVCTLMGESGFEEVWVAVIFDHSIDMTALRQQIESHSEFGSNIDRLFVVDTLPRGQLGKIQRNKLRDMLQSIDDETDSHT